MILQADPGRSFKALEKEIQSAVNRVLQSGWYILGKENEDFEKSFAYYNKANMLCLQQDFKAAISYYSQAIAADSDFAEAYFNRGLTYIYINETDKGVKDLSKAGELGIYQAYNLISRFQ